MHCILRSFYFALLAVVLLARPLDAQDELLASGSNLSGQFGLGTTGFASGPVSISTDAVGFAAGAGRTFLIKADGTLWASGSNDEGQLGDGTTTSRSSPVQIAGEVAAVAAGTRTLILKKDKSLWWIPGFTGSQPVQIAANVKRAAAGFYRLAYITESEELWTIRVEQGSFPDLPELTNVATDVAAVALGRAHTLFVKKDGTLWGWGSNFHGQLGDPISQGDRTDTPVKVTDGVRDVAADGDSSFFIKTDGTLWAMGANNSGELGDGTRQSRRVPAQVATEVVHVSAGDGYTLFLKRDGTAWGMGSTRSGQLGVVDGDLVANEPILIMGGLKAIAAGRSHSLFFREGSSQTETAVTLSESSREVGANGGRYVIGIASDGGWVPQTDASWLMFTRRVVARDGLLEIEVAPNNGNASRSAEVRIAGKVHTLVQRSRGKRFSELLAFGRDAEGQLGVSNVADGVWPAQIATGVRKVAAGSVGGPWDQTAHVLVLRTDGELWGFGRNNWGQLGQPASDAVLNWTKLASQVTQIAATPGHNFFLTSDGTLWKVGGEPKNHPGGGATDDANVPVLIASNVRSFSASGPHTLFVKTDGSLWAMGSNEFGQLGDGSRTERSVPVQVATNVAEAAAGFYHSLFLKTDGTLWGMGQASLGQLGDGATEQMRTSPQQLRSNVRAAAAGFTCSFFIDVEGRLWGMGVGPLGIGSVEPQPTPVEIARAVTFVSASWDHAFFIKDDRSLWGTGPNTNGELGDGTIKSRPHPVEIADEVTMVSATHGVTLFVKSDGSLWAMGDPEDFLWNRRPTPMLVDADVTDIAVGALHSAYVKEDGGLWSMGPQMLGNGLVVGSSRPVNVADSVVRVAAGDGFTLFAKTDGGLWAVGAEANDLFDVVGNPAPVPVRIESDVADIAAGTYHALYIKKDGALFATGDNYAGQLGVEGLSGSTKKPARSTTGVMRAAAAFQHSLILKIDGTLWAVGNTGLASGSTRSMVQVATDVIDVAVGRDHSLFLKRDSTLWAWGDNFYLQLGDSTNEDRSRPVEVAEDVAAFDGGVSHTVFAKTDGTLWTMGSNEYGQLGDGTFTSRATPTMVARGVVRVSAGQGFHTLVIRDASLPVIGAPTTFLADGNSAFDVAAEGVGTLGYQWERLTSVQAGWEVLTDGKLWTGTGKRHLVIAHDTVLSVGERFRCRVQNEAGALTSISIKTRASVIEAGPSSVTVDAGKVASFTAGAGGVPAPRLRWQQRLPGGSQWTEIVDGGLYEGSQTGRLTVGAAANLNGVQFRCVAMNGVGEPATSAAATLTVIGGNPYAGSYFGTILGDAGRWALQVAENGKGTLIGHLFQKNTVVVVSVTVATDGSFSGTGTEFSAAAQAPVSGRREGSIRALSVSEFMLSGIISGDALTGAVNGSVESLVGARESQGGLVPSGHYTAGSANDAGSLLQAIVAPSGRTFVIARTWAGVDSASGATSVAGEFSADSYKGGQILVKTVVGDQIAGVVYVPGSSAPVVFGDLDPNNDEEPGPDTAEPGVAGTRLVALAARAAAGGGDQTLIMGFVVDGNKEVLVQGVGPGIAGSVPTALADPRLELFRYQGGSFAKVDENNDWVNSSAITEARARLGASALAAGSKDAALLKTISGGVYTAHVASGGAAGVALVEAYDADGGGSSRLMALSTRTVAGAGDATLIAGFVLEGNGPKTVLIRGLGPELALRGVQGVLADPKITVYRGSNVVGSNDDWGGSAELKEAFSAVGAEQLASNTSKDAAMLVTLDPGAYTVHVTGAAGTTGVALVEIFDVP